MQITPFWADPPSPESGHTYLLTCINHDPGVAVNVLVRMRASGPCVHCGQDKFLGEMRFKMRRIRTGPRAQRRARRWLTQRCWLLLCKECYDAAS